MTEAEVAQQLIADLQANFGVFITCVLVVLVGAIIALGTTLSKASRSMREMQSALSGRVASAASPAGSPSFRSLAVSVEQASRPSARRSLAATRLQADRDILGRHTGPKQGGRAYQPLYRQAMPPVRTPRPRRNGTRQPLV